MIPAISLLITPSVSTDPINQPKMLLLAILASSLFGIFLFEIRKIFPMLQNIFGLLAVFFFIQITLVLLLAGAPFNQQFFGTFGRNTGYVTYASLVLVMIFAYLVSRVEIIPRFMAAIMLTGLISMIYSILQTYGMDPIKWANPYNPITAFLGNPNFQSSFLAISALPFASFFLDKFKSKNVRILCLVYLGSAIYLIYRSDSIQGFLVFAIGIVVIIFMRIFGEEKTRKKHIIIPYVLLTGFMGAITILGTLNRGPFAEYLYKLSVRQRGYYWDAALKMIREYPVTGVGMDSYGDWYFRFRSANAAFNTPTVGSNSAHNVFLEMGAFGGIPLLIIHMGISALAVYSIFFYLKRHPKFNWAYAGMVGAWLGYQSQAVISINQIGLAVWGWLLAGLIIGLNKIDKSKLSTLSKTDSSSKSKDRLIRNKTRENKTGILITAASMSVLALIFVTPVFVSDASFRKAITSKDGNELIKSVLAYPRDSNRMIQAAQVFANSGLPKESLNLLDKVVKENPRYYSAWELQKMLAIPGSKNYETIKQQLQVLNPQVEIE